MRINHNITAMNSYRNFSNNTSKLSKNLEKLSTGLKINRAGDDAAGLAISEKMRAQISGIDGATKNSKDGISLIQTAEGALTEVHDMLNRMTTLAEQSANGTYDDDVDRAQLQKEVDSLKSEIDRIADSTNYNGIKLLDGSLSGASNIKGGVTVADVEATVAKAGTSAFANVASLSAKDKLTYTVSWQDKDGNNKATTVEFTIGKSNTADSTTYNDALIAADGTKYSMSTAGTASKGELRDAIAAELNKDSEFAANFKAAGDASSLATTVEGSNNVAGAADGIMFTSKTSGTSGSVVQSVELKKQVYDSASDTYTTTTVSDGSAIGARIRAKDASQELNLDNIRVLKVSDVDETDGRIEANTFEVGGKKFALMSNGENADIDKFKAAVGSDVTIIQVSSAKGAAYVSNAADAKTIAGELTRVTGMKFAVDGNKVVTAGDTKLQAAKGKSLDLQIGDTADSFNKLSVNVKDCHSASIGIGDVDISTQEGAAAALDKIKAAVNNVSDVRGSLGALQNRLDHTINNLGVMKENIQSAESVIRDTDVAEEMMTYTKNNILNQSAQAMLAQANQLPQGVLQLLG